MAKSTLLLRQVVLSHGHAVPPFPLGPVRRWLEQLPSSEVSKALDRCTVVLPRPGDGWYAPPSSGSPAGFPWGELTQRGVNQIRQQGADWAAGNATSKVLLRAANRACCITSAQAFALGAREGSSTWTSPWEVLVQRGEALLPQLAPKETLQAASLVQEIAAALGETEPPHASRRLSEAEDLCHAVMSLPELAGGAVESVKRQNYLHWTQLMKQDAGPVIWPFLAEMLHACDVRLDGDDTGTVIYAVDAASLVCLEEVLVPGSDGMWPEAGASLSLELWEVAGSPVVSLRHRNEVFEGEQLPYDPFRRQLEQLRWEDG